MLKILTQFIEDILILGVFKGPNLGPLEKHNWQGPVQL